MSNVKSSLIFGSTLLAICIGCQPRTGTVSGTVTLDDRPLTLDTDSRGTVVFQQGNGQGAMATGVLDPSGHFTLSTGALPEVLPGKYQVTVSIVQLLPRTDQAPQTARLITPAKYGSAIDSGLQAEVAPGENEFQFNLVSDVVEEQTVGSEATATATEKAAVETPESSTEN